MGSTRRVSELALLVVLHTVSTFAQPSFERDVRPVFEANCFSCHGGTVMLGLDLRTVTSILRGSHEGPVVVKGSPEKSLLYEKLSTRMMPPPAFNMKLTDAQIDSVRRWIEEGMPSDEGAALAAQTREETARFEKLALPSLRAAASPAMAWRIPWVAWTCACSSRC